MLVRRVRGILVTATMFGIGNWLLAMVFTAVAWLATDDRRRTGHGLLSQLADSSRWSLGLGAAEGALLALLLIIAEGHQTAETVSNSRFRLWGAIAGAVPFAVFFEIMHTRGSSGLPPCLVATTICLAASTGWNVAGRMLRLARRGEANVT